MFINLVMFLTGGGFAYGGVFRAKLEALHTQAVEAAVRVDAALRAGVAAAALVHVHARLTVVLQTEAWVTAALGGGGGGRNTVGFIHLELL